MKNDLFRIAIASLLCCTMIMPGCKATPQATIAPTATLIDTENNAKVQFLISAATAGTIQGFILVVPVLVHNVRLIRDEVHADGAYREELLFDNTVSIVVERLARVGFNEDAIAKQINKLNGMDASDIVVKKDDAVTARLSYPAWRIIYTTGKDEQTRKNVDIYIQTDDWDYRFHTSTPADVFENYNDSIEYWIESLDLFDASRH